MQSNMQQYFEKLIREKDQEISELQRSQVNSDPLSQPFADLDGPWDHGLNMTPAATVGSPSAHSASNPATPKMNSIPVSNAIGKKDAGMPFNRDTFYMCLLFGALIASQSSLLSATSSIPCLSEEYQSDSANLLKVLLEGDDPVPPLTPSMGSVVSTAFCDSTSSPTMPSHDALLTPSSQSRKVGEQFFALPEDEFRDYTTLGCEDDMMDNEGLDSSSVRLGHGHGDNDGFSLNIGKPSAIQNGFNAMGASGGFGGFSNSYIDNDHRMGFGNMPRSLKDLPEKVVRDFRQLVRQSGLPLGKISVPAT